MNFKIKKQHILLSLGAVSTVALPLAAVVACGDMTDAEKVAATAAAFNKDTIKTQKVPVYFQQALATSADAAAINAVLVNKLPAITAGVTVTYTVSAVSETAFTQVIDVNISAGEATPATAQITLTYHGTSLADFNAAYPNKITTSNTVVAGAFDGRTDLPADFALPAGLTTISTHAFRGATLPAGFNLPITVTTIAAGAFQNAKLPAGFMIPSVATNIPSDAFAGTTAPAGYQWQEANGTPLAAGALPAAGNMVGKIAAAPAA